MGLDELEKKIEARLSAYRVEGSGLWNQNICELDWVLSELKKLKEGPGR